MVIARFISRFIQTRRWKVLLKDIIRITEKLDLIYEHLRILDDNFELLNQRIAKIESKMDKLMPKK